MQKTLEATLKRSTSTVSDSSVTSSTSSRFEGVSLFDTYREIVKNSVRESRQIEDYIQDCIIFLIQPKQKYMKIPQTILTDKPFVTSQPIKNIYSLFTAPTLTKKYCNNCMFSFFSNRSHIGRSLSVEG